LVSTAAACDFSLSAFSGAGMLDVQDFARRVLRIEASALVEAGRRLNSSFEQAARLIEAHVPPGRVVVCGVGKSGHVGKKIAATLASTGTPSFFVHPTEAAHGDLGMMAAGDIVLGISYSGRSEELLQLLPYFKRHRIPLIALTGGLDSALATNAECVIDASVSEEACPLGLAPTTSTTVALALGDALAMTLLELRGFTRDDFALTHPSGSLGRRLLVHVRDVMLAGDAVPRVRPETTIRDSLIEMNRGGIGITAVVDSRDDLVGIFTDGDLRRALDRSIDVYRTPVADVMSRSPKTIAENQLAAAIPEIMERHKVTAVLVVDAGGRLCGAVNTRLLLQAGVI
jgi:arabinose-5-phosphate isomerase